jgi:nucleoside-diphosphate-sugar epimerase
MGELLVHAYHANFNLDYTILRLFNVFGKGDRGIIGRSVLAAINGDELPVFRLDQLRDFVYAGDVAASFERALRTPAARNETVNIGSGQGLTIEQTVTMVRKLLPSLKTVLSERTDYVPYDSVADNRRAQALLGVRFGAGLEFVRRIVQKELLAG